MPGFLHLMSCVGRAVVKNGAGALVSLVPFGNALFDIAKDTLEDYRKGGSNSEAALRAELEAMAQASPTEVRKAAEEVASVEAKGQPDAIRLTLISTLSQMQDSTRHSLRRPADPSGKTVPAGLSLKTPTDLMQFLPTRPPRFKPGDRPLPGVGWELEKLLGIGGFGEVWKARNSRLTNITAALKFCLDPEAGAALLNEGANLNHVLKAGRQAGIVELKNAYLDTEPYCLEYEFIEGNDLAGAIHSYQSAKGPLTPDQATRIIRDLARPVGRVHKLSPPIVHRDLKPANVLVRTREGKSEFLITDFGIGGVAASQALEQTRQGISSTPMLTSLQGAHTPLYASPEQKRGEPPDPRDDVHALGVIWYQLLVSDMSQAPPFDWIAELQSRKVDGGIIDLLGRCIAGKAERRPADAAVLADRLTALLAQPKAGDVSTNSLSMKFAFVPSGSFLMGGEDGEPGDEEVTIERDFRLGVYPVTQGQWQAVMGTNPSHFSRTGDGKDDVKDVSDAELKDFPVEQVSWDDVQGFLGKLNEREKDSGFVYRLPTEAEWEYACRGAALSSGGSMSKEECSFDFYFQPQPTNALSSRQANFNGKYPCGGAGKGPYLGRTCKVGSYQPNRLGIYDLHGNVWEWCQDTDDGGETRVFRGGGCYDGAKDCRAATRDEAEPSWCGGHVGVRLVLVPSGSASGEHAKTCGA